MADALEQTKDIFSVDDFNEDDISDKSKLVKALENPFGEFRPKEEIIEKAKATGTGLLTGTLGIPSDVATLASAVSSGMAKYADSPTAMMLKDVLEKARDDVGRPAFDKWFTETTGLESNPENVDQLVGEVLSPTGAFLAPVKTLKNIFAPLKKGVTDFFDKMPPPDSGLAVETAGVGQLNQTKKLLDKEKTFVADNVTTIPPQEFINAPKTTKMSMAGNRTPTGKKQIEKFRELDKTKKYNPDELFEKTGVYKGEDGKFRWEIDTSDAELKNLDTIKNAKDEDAFALSNLLKFDRLYQEYFEPIKVSRPSSVYKGQSARFNYKPMKNLSVVVKRGSDEDAGALASYSPASDRITIYPDRILSSALKSKNRYPDVSINDLYKYRLESSILHEVQHAIQGREGFVRGSNTENFLPKTYEQDIKTNNKLLDDSYVNFFDQFKAEDVLRTSKDRYDVDSASNSIQSIIGADLNNIKDPTIVNIAFRDAMSKLRDVNLRTPLKEKIVNGYIQRVQQYFQNKKLIDNEFDKAYGKYRDTYGEKEARLVQDRFEKRLNLKSQSKNIQDEMSKTKIPEDMMGTTRAEKERLSKLARTDPVTGKVRRRVSIPIENEIEFAEKVRDIETTPVKKSPALQRISEIAKLQDGPLGSRTPMDKDGLPKNLLRDKDGKPLVLYYGDMGQVYDPKTHTYTSSDIPGKLTNKFEPSGRTYTTDKKVGNFVTPNPVFASGYASKEGGSVIPVYLIADKVSNIKARSFSDIDKAGGDAKRGEVFIGDVGYDSAPPVKLVNGREVKDLELRDESIKKYGTEQYTFNRGTQVFSAITGERLTELPTINQNIRNKLLNLTQKEEDIALKNMSPEEQIKYKAEKTYTEDFIDQPDFVEDMFKLNRKGDIERNEKKRNLAKGGDMNKQMEMFEDGGLKQEGGTIDPVSGNDVPPGSTQEEVRDDIPAQLSEGEFVFPADVVRYIGLEKLMRLRQEAKQGLKMMEQMGQMGNSEEATMPDDLPFDETDLDIEDEEEYNNDTQEMNQGGVIQAQTGTFVAPGAGITTMPSQFAGQQLPSAGTTPSYTVPNIPPPTPAPVGGFTPIMSGQVGQQPTSVTPSFQSLIGRTPGQYDEFREYTNESGMKLQIPFKDGQPIYPIPEGYTYVDPEEIKTEEVTTKQVTPTTTRVTEQDGGDDSSTTTTSAVDLTGAPLSYQSMFNMDKLDTALKDIAFGQLNTFSIKGGISRGLQNLVDLNSITLDLQKDVMGNFKNQFELTDKYGPNFNLAVMNKMERDSLANSLNDASKFATTVLTDVDQKPLDINGLVSKANKAYGMNVTKNSLYSKGTNILSKSKISNLAREMMKQEMAQQEKSKAARAEFERYSDPSYDTEAERGLSDAVSAADRAQAAAEARFNVEETFGSGEPDSGPKGGAPSQGPSDMGLGSISTDNDGGQASSSDDGGYSDSGYSDSVDTSGFSTGGLAGKKKVKTKKMKRGGLASKK